ncbi:hypothetical protein VTN02DRAFT_1365 [Thermoascus thermophilus]
MVVMGETSDDGRCRLYFYSNERHDRPAVFPTSLGMEDFSIDSWRDGRQCRQKGTDGPPWPDRLSVIIIILLLLLLLSCSPGSGPQRHERGGIGPI